MVLLAVANEQRWPRGRVAALDSYRLVWPDAPVRVAPQRTSKGLMSLLGETRGIHGDQISSRCLPCAYIMIRHTVHDEKAVIPAGRLRLLFAALTSTL